MIDRWREEILWCVLVSREGKKSMGRRREKGEIGGEWKLAGADCEESRNERIQLLR